jgi:L1 cell adhesion molecule like protein
LVDVIPLSLGLETAGGCMTVIIPRNTSIPVSKKQIFSTYVNNQYAVSVKVYEGERGLTKDNNLLGEFNLSGIPPMPRGVPQIEINYEIDSNGLLNITAVEKSTGVSDKITITNDKNRLTQEEIDRMIKEGDEFKESDNKIKEVITIKNELRNHCDHVKMKCGSKEIISKMDKILMLLENEESIDVLKEQLEFVKSFMKKTTKLSDL